MKLKKDGRVIRTKNEKIIIAIMFILFVVYALTLLYPFVWALYNSLKTGREFNENQFSFPTLLNWSNYSGAFSQKVGSTNILVSIFNSVWMTVLNVTMGIAACAVTAYVSAKYKFKGSGLIYAVSVFIQIIPLVGNLPATYRLLHNTLGIANNPFLIWVIWFGGFGFSFLLLYSAFKSVSWDYAEAAFIDGASNFQTFLRVMLPMIKPVLVSLAVINSISVWNDYMTPYLYMNDYPTLSLAVYELSDDAMRLGGVPNYFAIIIIAVIPTLLVFIMFQNTIMENTTTGGIKG